MVKQQIIISHDLQKNLTKAVGECPHDRLFVLTDTTTFQCCWPLVADFPCMQDARMMTIGATDEAKTLESLAHVWKELQQGGATRHSLMVNLGGGMVTDLGGFAASTFKRGIQFINVPTTLLSMVDASVGGKTGINFGGLKNEIGVFCCSQSVILDATFLRTLDRANILSGYAEMLKHGLISDEKHWAEVMNFDLAGNFSESFETFESSRNFSKNLENLENLEKAENVKEKISRLTDLVAESVAVKERIVEEDPQEHGIRKALNLGHTVGHAFESLAMRENRTVLHGYAVAWGLICELYLSILKAGFPTEKMRQTVQFVREHYGRFDIDCKQYDALYELMLHDKKNTADRINFTLLGGIGDIRINQTATREEIFDMFDFFREG